MNTQHNEMTADEMDQVSGGPAFVKIGDLRGKRMSRKGVNSVLGQANGFVRTDLGGVFS